MYQQLGPQGLRSLNQLKDSWKVMNAFAVNNNANLNQKITKVLTVDDKNKKIIKDLTVNDIAKLAANNGLIGGQTSFEINRDVIQNLIQFLPENKQTKLQKIFGSIGLGGVQNVSNILASDMDSLFRVSVLIDQLKNGKSEAVAIAKARQALFDYNSLSEIERKYIAHNFFFYSFMRHNFVSTFRNIASGKGGTRIKNLGLFLYGDQDSLEDDSYKSPGDDSAMRIKFYEKPDQDINMFGPAIPQYEGLKQLTNLPILVYSGYYAPYETMWNSIDDIQASTLLPATKALFDFFSKGQLELRYQALSSNRVDPRVIQFYKSIDNIIPGTFDYFKDYFKIEEDVNKGNNIGDLADDNLYDRNDYKFRTNPDGSVNNLGKFRYTLLIKLMQDYVFAAGRKFRDLGYLNDPRLSLPEKISTFSGLTTPLKQKYPRDRTIDDLRKKQEEESFKPLK
jgi:hypothetical protein